MESYEELTREELIKRVKAMAATIAELKIKLQQNSRNSSKPPSSDGLSKPSVKSLRKKSGKKAGGQKGHKGHGLKITREPDEVIQVAPVKCGECGCALPQGAMSKVDTRYVSDVRIDVTLIRYDIHKGVCPQCGAGTPGTPPPDCKGTVNYGNLVRTLGVVLTQYANVGIDKTHKILRDLLNVPISGGTIHNMMRECASSPATCGTIGEIKRNLLLSPSLNTDETGGRVCAQPQWFHVASNSRYTLITIHPKRGREGSEAGGVLQEYEGTLVHDCWKPYFGFDKCEHALCCAHLLRELTALVEQGQVWAEDMIQLLMGMKHAVDRAKENDKTELSRYYHKKFKTRYETILQTAKAEIPPSTTRKKSKAENILIRLEAYQTEITRFTHDFEVPFDNNQAERDVRNVKVKTKVSGGFRTQAGAENYAKSASVIGTVIKQGISVVHAVRDLFRCQNPCQRFMKTSEVKKQLTHENCRERGNVGGCTPPSPRPLNIKERREKTNGADEYQAMCSFLQQQKNTKRENIASAESEEAIFSLW
jgi:transposase